MAAVDPKTKLANAALRLLAKTRWSDLSLLAVARAAKITPTMLQTIARSKPALIGLILSRIETDVAKRYVPDPQSVDARERVFDVVMVWFDVWVAHRAALRALYEGLRREPLSLLAARDDVFSAAGFLLALAEADTGRAGALKAAGLAGIIGHAIPAFLDDGKDLAATMASLDRDLARADRFLNRGKKAENDQP